MSSVIRWDKKAFKITVGASMELYDLVAVELKQRGVTLPSMSVPTHGGLTVGGVVATAAHGMNSLPGEGHMVSFILLMHIQTFG
jgi:FAD/FMN-containing dehydrogenase